MHKASRYFPALLATLLMADSALAQSDPGVRDSIVLECPIAAPDFSAGDSVGVPVLLWNDEAVSGFVFVFQHDGDSIEFSSVQWNPGFSWADWAKLLRNGPSEKAVKKIAIGAADFGGETPIPPSSNYFLIATLWLRAKPGFTQQVVDIDTTSIYPSTRLQVVYNSGSGSFDLIPIYRDCGFQDAILGTTSLICGDFDASQRISIADLVYLINYIFNDGPEPHDICLGSVDCEVGVTMADCIYLVQYIFNNGPAPCLRN